MEDTGSKYIRLTDQSGQVIVPQNAAKFKPEHRAEQIEKVLKPESIYPNGSYFIELRQSAAGHPVKFEVQKGSQLNDAPVMKVNQASPVNDELLARLSSIESKLSEISVQDDDDPEPLAESKPGFDPTNIIVAFAPLADRILSMFEKKLSPPPPQPAPVLNDRNTDQLSGFIASLIAESTAAGVSIETVQAYIDSLQHIDRDIHKKVFTLLQSYATAE